MNEDPEFSEAGRWPRIVAYPLIAAGAAFFWWVLYNICKG